VCPYERVVMLEREIVNPRCPYCNVELNPVPQRRKKCPACGNVIHIKTRPSDRKRILTTEDGAKAIDAEWTALERARIDARWRELNKELSSAAKSNDWHRMSSIYFGLALIRHDEGKEFFSVLQECARCNLIGFEKSGVVKRVKVLTCGEQSCSECQPLQGQIFDIREALDKMPIPVRTCQHDRGWCRCMYLPVMK